MSYTITSQCIECDRCLSVCPTDAIQSNYRIDSTRCNNCADSYSVAQCAAVCPTNYGCVPGTTSAATHITSDEYWKRWFTAYQRLTLNLNDACGTRIRDRTASYWLDWFDLYSERLSTLLSQHSGTRNADLHLSR